MGWLQRQVRRFGRARGLLGTLEGIRRELQRANDYKRQELLASGVDVEAPSAPPLDAAEPPISVQVVDTELAAEMAEIELTLTHSLGMPPSEEQVLAEYERLHTEPDDPRRLSVLEQGYREAGSRWNG